MALRKWELLDGSEQRAIQQGVEPPPREDAERLEQDFKKKNRLSLLIGLAGILFQVGVGGYFVWLGTLLFIGALVVYAQMRGRSAWWGAFGFLSIFGFFVLYFLGKNCEWCGERNSHRSDTCERCSAPLSP